MEQPWFYFWQIFHQEKSDISMGILPLVSIPTDQIASCYSVTLVNISHVYCSSIQWLHSMFPCSVHYWSFLLLVVDACWHISRNPLLSIISLYTIKFTRNRCHGRLSNCTVSLCLHALQHLNLYFISWHSKCHGNSQIDSLRTIRKQSEKN
jgi:hypothetical protein